MQKHYDQMPSVSAIICMQSVMQELKAGIFKSAVCVNIALERSVEKRYSHFGFSDWHHCLLFTLWNGRLGTKAAWNLSVKEYLICGLILWITQAGIYLLHFFWQYVSEVGLSGSRSCATQSLIAALLFTGLGDGLWMVSMWMGWTSAVVLCKMENKSEVF